MQTSEKAKHPVVCLQIAIGRLSAIVVERAHCSRILPLLYSRYSSMQALVRRSCGGGGGGGGGDDDDGARAQRKPPITSTEQSAASCTRQRARARDDYRQQAKAELAGFFNDRICSASMSVKSARAHCRALAHISDIKDAFQVNLRVFMLQESARAPEATKMPRARARARLSAVNRSVSRLRARRIDDFRWPFCRKRA